MSGKKRIDKAYARARAVTLSDGDSYVVISDCHRGVGDHADDFAKNQTVYEAALRYYSRMNFTCIELGDGDELWKNRNFRDITSAHGEIFSLLARLYRKNRLLLLYGNHDIEKKYKPGLMDSRAGPSGKRDLPLFPGAVIGESLILKIAGTDHEVLLLHGHQADFFNDTLWPLARFLVRHVWMPLELLGLSDPTSAARNNKVQDRVELTLSAWASSEHKAVIAGHTHRPVFPEPGEGRYFNDGSCVHPFSITAIEISKGNISLVRWGQKADDNGAVFIGRETLGGPARLTDYYI